VRVREALHCAWKGLPDTEYVRCVDRSQRDTGLDLGPKYNNDKFARRVEFLAEVAARGLCADAMHRPLGSLGIPSDLVVTWDGVNIGGTTGGFSRNETLSLIGLGFVDAASGAIRYDLAGAPSLATRHGGEEQVRLVKESLAAVPLRLTEQLCAARVAIAGGDGQVSAAGRKHPSTGAAETLWRSWHPTLVPGPAGVPAAGPAPAGVPAAGPGPAGVPAAGPGPAGVPAAT